VPSKLVELSIFLAELPLAGLPGARLTNLGGGDQKKVLRVREVGVSWTNLRTNRRKPTELGQGETLFAFLFALALSLALPLLEPQLPLLSWKEIIDRGEEGIKKGFTVNPEP